MGRRYTREEYLELVRKIRQKMPDCALTTDIIVGFPNETEEQFEDTLSLCEEVGYDAAFTFIYSPRKGTPAAKMVDDVTDQAKHARFDRLVKVVEQGVVRHADAMVGKTYSVLVDGPSKKDPGVLSGYAENGKLVHFLGPKQLIGHIVPVRIEEARAFSVKGVLAEDAWLCLAKDLKAQLLEEDAAKRYFACKEAAKRDDGLPALRQEMVRHQVAMSLALKNGDDALYAEEKAAYFSAKAAYENHPLLQNLLTAGEEMRELLLRVMESLT